MASRAAVAGAVVAAGSATLALLLGTTFLGFTWLIVPAALLALGSGLAAERLAPQSRFFVLWFGVVGAIGVVSILSGLLNGLSDEPYSTPAYAALGLGMYSHPVSFTYVQYGRTYLETSYDVYLPLLTYLQVPGLDYRWVSLAAWAATLWMLRDDRVAATGWATPWIVVLAANGQNDFVPLLFVTLAVARQATRLGWLAEVIALGLKQFGNVLVFGYHLVRREYRAAAAAIAVTVGLLLPFLLIDPSGVWCHVFVGDPGNGCTGHPWTFFVFKRNYWLYPTWAVLVFHRPIRTWLHARFGGRSTGPTVAPGPPP